MLAGRSSLLIAGSNARVAELASYVRARLVAAGAVAEAGTVTADGNRAGVGDLIQARLNDWSQVAPDGIPVINRHVYQVVDRHQDGSLVVQRDPAADETPGWWWNPQIILAPDYLAKHVSLAYATTKEAAQGRTVDTGHLVVDEHTSREGLYVGLTRGRESNRAYITTETEASEVGGPEQTDRFAVLTRILEADTGQRAATEVLREEHDAADHLGRLGPIWTSLVEDDTRARYTRTLVDRLGPDRAAEVAADEAGGPLLRLLRSAELAGHDPAAVIDAAAGERSLDDARSVAEVLHHRISRQLGTSPTDRTAGQAGEHTEVGPPAARSFLERTPPIDGPVGDYVRQLAEVMDARTGGSVTAPPTSCPAGRSTSWARCPATWSPAASGPAGLGRSPPTGSSTATPLTAIRSGRHRRRATRTPGWRGMPPTPRLAPPRTPGRSRPVPTPSCRPTSTGTPARSCGRRRTWPSSCARRPARHVAGGPGWSGSAPNSPAPASRRQPRPCRPGGRRRHRRTDPAGRTGPLARAVPACRRGHRPRRRRAGGDPHCPDRLARAHRGRPAGRPRCPNRARPSPPARADQPAQPAAPAAERVDSTVPPAADRQAALEAARQATQTLAARQAEREQAEQDDARRRGDDWARQHQPNQPQSSGPTLDH